MDITEMTVCDADGSVAEAGARIRADGNNPYKFYAHGGGAVFVVTLLLPLGGVQSGLYRFPEVGEKVLVAHDKGSAGHLLGYVPSAVQPYDNKEGGMDELIKKRGEMFRYQKSGENASAARYSEIGFTTEDTLWKQAGRAAPPPVDRITIESSGDIREEAENHHQIRAKRFEILVDCPAADGAPPLGDKPGDDAELYRGDGHIRAATRLVLKAGEEIRLEVGRSSVVISDDGISIVTRKTCTPQANPWDTVLNLTPRDGIAAFGQKVDIGAAQSFSLRESAGGSLSSFGGVTRLCARDFMAQAYGAYAYKANTVEMDKTMTAVFKTMKDETGETPSFSAMAPSLAGLLTAANWGVASSGSNYSDLVGDYADFCAHLLEALSATYTTLDLTMPQKLRESSGGRDALNKAALLDQYKILKKMLAYVAASGAPDKAMHNSFLHLTSGADAVLSGYGLKHYSAEQTDGSVPTAGINENMTANQTKRLSGNMAYGENVNGGEESGILKHIAERAAKKQLWAVDADAPALEKRKEL
jgi:hypothetical protein